MRKTANILGIIFICAFAVLCILKPNVCIKSAANGILICGNVIIPSVYPFTFCAIFIKNSGVFKFLKPCNKLTTRLLGQNYYEFSIFLMSLVSGYPTGAKLLSENGSKNSNKMINYCINAGPAFIILAVGRGIFKSAIIGWILFFSHIVSSIIIAFLSKFTLKSNLAPNKIPSLNPVNNFVISASDAAETVIKICSLVILFACISGYIELFSVYLKPIKYIGFLCEVTNGVVKCKNILLASFLLGFSGFSIWAQVFSLLKNAKIKTLNFVFFRLLHGGLSATITYLLLKCFNITINTLSNGVRFDYNAFINGPVVAFSLTITGIVFIISLYNKKYAGKIIEDIV